jgi:hypothetical protein
MNMERLRTFAVKAIQKFRPRLGLRESDIILASFPKSGNTWMRFIWGNMISIMEFEGENINFKVLDTKFAAEYDSKSYGEIEFECLPRLVKTHKKYRPRAFSKSRCIYVVRHPGDVAISYFEYKKSEKKDYDISGLDEFIRNSKYGVPAWCEHVQSWHQKADCLVQYEELKSDAVETVQRLLKEFNLYHVEEETIVQAVERSSFDRMKGIERKEGRVREGDFDSDHQFMRSGKTGEWKERLGKESIDYIKNELHKNDLNELYNF